MILEPQSQLKEKKKDFAKYKLRLKKIKQKMTDI